MKECLGNEISFYKLTSDNPRSPPAGHWDLVRIFYNLGGKASWPEEKVGRGGADGPHGRTDRRHSKPLWPIASGGKMGHENRQRQLNYILARKDKTCFRKIVNLSPLCL